MEDIKNIIASIQKKIVNEASKRQFENPKDSIDEDTGLLVCGVCGEFKQGYLDTVDGDRVKYPVQCRCDKKAAEEELKNAELVKKNMRIAKLRMFSLIDEKFSNATFDRFVQNTSNHKNLKICKNYVDRFDAMIEKNQGLLMYGDVGTGKTFSAACIANELIKKGIPVVVTSFVKILELITKNPVNEMLFIEKMSHADLVVFDDLGAERSSEYALEKVYNLVDSRYRQKRPMIFTTNIILPDMKNVLDVRHKRIYDRIFEVCYPLQFTGDSWRLINAKNRYNEMEKILG